MKSDGRIKTDVYRVIKGSSLEAAVTGNLSKRGRSGKSDKEDIVISILDNGSGQRQEAFVNVNIYVPDIQDSDTKEFIINDIRVDELSELAIQLLEAYNGGDFRFEIDKQRVFPVEGKNEHLINNRLLYMQSNG
jgi:hypothetical protein